MMMKPDRNDLFVAAGLLMLGSGLMLIDLSLALSVIGGLLLAMGLIGAWLKGGRQ